MARSAMANEKEALVAALSEALTGELVAIPTPNPPGREKACAEFIVDTLQGTAVVAFIATVQLGALNCDPGPPWKLVWRRMPVTQPALACVQLFPRRPSLQEVTVTCSKLIMFVAIAAFPIRVMEEFGACGRSRYRHGHDSMARESRWG